MPALHWLRCKNDHVQEDVFVSADALPPCPECGSSNSITWEHGQPPNDGLFRPMKVGEGRTIETREELNRLAARASATHGMDFVVESVSKEQHRAEIEERRHRIYAREKAKGVDATLKAEHHEARNRVKEEAATGALRRNEDPGKAASQAAKAVGSLATAAKGAGV